MEDKVGRKITTTIEPARFKAARNGDQKYYLRHNPTLWAEFKKHYPNQQDIYNSAAAAKVNGYLGGFSNQEQFQVYGPKLGLSTSSLKRLGRQVPKRASHYIPQCKLPSNGE